MMRARTWIAIVIVLGVVSWALMLATPAISQTPPERVAVVGVYGGGWYSGTPARMSRVCSEVAVPLELDCFLPAYTLSGVAPYPTANRDLVSYLEDLRADGYTFLVGVGSSAGGNLVGWLAGRGHLDAAVTLSAPSRLETLTDWHRGACSCWIIRQFAPTREKEIAASPTSMSIDVPILIFHTAGETLIPALQAHRLAGVSSQPTLRVLPGDRHGMSYWPDVQPEIVAFVDELTTQGGTG